jgi:hypothetical protein
MVMNGAKDMPDPKIAELHDLYCKLTGFPLPLRMGRDRAWFDYDKAGFTADDLILVIGWIRRQMNIARTGYTMASLRFSTLLQLDYFEEKLHLARMDKRASQRPPKLAQQEQQVGDVRRQVEVPNDGGDPKPAGEIANEQLRQLKELRHRLAGTAVPTS